MLQSNFKTKLNTIISRHRIKKWRSWKDLCKAEPDKYKIEIAGNESLVSFILLQWCYEDREWTVLESMDWSLE